MTGAWRALLGDADWLDAARVRRWAVACLAVQLVCGIVLAAGTHGMLVRLPKASTTDFVSFYAAGKVAAGAAPARVYDRPTHYAAEKAATDPGIAYVYFFYPPVYLLYCRVLAALPYLPAFLGFELAGMALCALPLRAMLRDAPGTWWLPLLSFSPALWNLGFGQNAFLTAALFGGGTWLLHRGRHLAGGLVLGLLFYKPHTGLLIPLALLAARDWRAILGAGTSVVGTIALSIGMFGLETWRRFLTVMLHSPAEFGAGAITPFMATVNVLGALRDHGVGLRAAWIAQAALQVCVIIVIVGVWRDRGQRRDGAAAAALISGSLLMMPIVLFYDLTSLLMAAGWMLRDARRGGFLPGEKVTLAAIWIGGLLCYPLARLWHLPLGLLCILAMFVLAVRRHGHGDTPVALGSRSSLGAIVGPALSAFRRMVPDTMTKRRLPTCYASILRELFMIDYVRNWVAIKADKRGVTALEYAIIAGVLGIGLVAIFGTFKTSLGTLFTSIATAM